MKPIITSIVMALCLVFSIGTILTVNNYAERKNEAEKSLSAAVDSAMNSVKYTKGGYDTENYENLTNDILQNIILQVNSDSKVTIKILNMDLENGLIDVEVTEQYKWFGISKNISTRRTIILDEYEYIENVDFHLATFKVQDEVYQSVDVAEEDVLVPPEDPNVEGYTFKGWYVEEDSDKDVITKSEWNNMHIGEDVTFVALYSTN